MLFVERANESEYAACLSPSRAKAQRKRVLKARFWLYIQDPKPGELTMARVKADENRLEARTS